MVHDQVECTNSSYYKRCVCKSNSILESAKYSVTNVPKTIDAFVFVKVSNLVEL